jgi:uncharacterized protein YdcH (DUF465 family)
MDQQAAGREATEPSLLRRLEEEHRRCGQKLESLIAKPYPSEEDRWEEVRLKKLKLRLKDQISRIVKEPDSVISSM